MKATLCEGCGEVVLDDIRTFISHKPTRSCAPEGGRAKEMCPKWLMNNKELKL